MTRILKKTRIKALPPKMQLRTIDAMSGSFPAHIRIASDNRTGNFSSFFDDLNSISFKSVDLVLHPLTSNEGLALPSGLHTSSPSLSYVDLTGALKPNKELLTDIIVKGVVRKGVGDANAVVERHGQSFEPFRDSNHPAVDGNSLGNSFYATGSREDVVGEGFDQPLWSKTKIEIDLTPSIEHGFNIQNYFSSSNNYTMAYWNTERKVWEGIGNGKEFGNYIIGSQSYFEALCEDQCLGFANGMNQGSSGFEDYSIGAKVSNFGFPYHVKYHASSSNLISMSDYISCPFLLEKIVLEWSGSLQFNNTLNGSFTGYTATTFFILNQRRPFGINVPDAQSFVYKTADGRTHMLVTGALLPSSYNGRASQNTVRDLVTYSQIVGFAVASDSTSTQKQRGSRELNIFSDDPRAKTNGTTWAGKMQMSGVVKNALPNDGLTALQIGHNDFGNSGMMLINKNSTRSGLFTPGGRDFLGALEKGVVLTSSVTLPPSFIGLGDPTGRTIVLDRYSKPNPYLLQPSDQLVFGWQLPIDQMINSANGLPQYSGKGPELRFAPHPSKIVFYGSMISEGKEHHDTLNQLLTSVSVHEVIE